MMDFVVDDVEQQGVNRHLPLAERCVDLLKAALVVEEGLRRRIDEASRYVPLERLALSPQCGFASTEEGNALSAAEMREAQPG